MLNIDNEIIVTIKTGMITILKQKMITIYRQTRSKHCSNKR